MGEWKNNWYASPRGKKPLSDHPGIPFSILSVFILPEFLQVPQVYSSVNLRADDFLQIYVDNLGFNYFDEIFDAEPMKVLKDPQESVAYRNQVRK